MDWAGTGGWTYTPSPPVASSSTGSKSFTGAKGRLRLSAGLVANEVAVGSKVYPSGADLAAISAPMLPVAPGRLSVTTADFQRPTSLGPRTRDRISAPVPGV